MRKSSDRTVADIAWKYRGGVFLLGVKVKRRSHTYWLTSCFPQGRQALIHRDADTCFAALHPRLDGVDGGVILWAMLRKC